ncbi:uncharacterized protein KY384_008852 [Bacidia gigantensis]|uniref:uncharacterized protein n=1 Tax=Bacidia gigantensis TaxID=2732470 RepID=UPI001D0538A1|nr:uncharacterized protein KY384_008852 [Bacidia gigantensis]KAG8525208.1 hypothetical protein KY384_008852 [Bacidia gigantensis]
MAVSNGFGQHESLIPPAQIKQFRKWTNIDWILGFLCFGFIRASILFFVLRLLPVYKRWQKNVILAAFVFNIAITLIATVSYGLSFITNQVNGVLSCVVDIVTAIIPQVLLWKVQMKKSSKRSLNIIFSLGLITSSLSIARVATISDKAQNEDSSFRLLVTGTCSLVEGEMGIICACGPAIRQFIAYIHRTGTVLPSSSRQCPNQDFVEMRRRIQLRDIFWYQGPNLIAGRVLDALPIRTQRSKEDVEATAQRSLLGDWRRTIKGKIFSGMDSETSLWTRKTSVTTSQQESRRIGRKYREWGLLNSQSAASDIDIKSPILNGDKTILGADRDHELAKILADPVKAAEGDERHSSMPIARGMTEKSGGSYINTPLKAARTQQRRM